MKTMTILELFIWAAHHKVEEFPLYCFDDDCAFMELKEENLEICKMENGDKKNAVILG